MTPVGQQAGAQSLVYPHQYLVSMWVMSYTRNAFVQIGLTSGSQNTDLN
jgi:hypothetical protein